MNVKWGRMCTAHYIMSKNVCFRFLVTKLLLCSSAVLKMTEVWSPHNNGHGQWVRSPCVLWMGNCTCNNKPPSNYHLALQFPSASWSFLASFSSLFWLLQLTTLLFWFTLIILVLFLNTGSVFSDKALLNPLYTIWQCHTKRQTDKVSNQLGNTN